MKNLAGYVGCAGFFLILMGLIFNALVWPTLKCRKKSVTFSQR